MAEDPNRKWWALIAIAASVLVVGLDLTVLNLALPTIAADAARLDQRPAVVLRRVQPGAGGGDAARRACSVTGYGRKKVLLIALVVFGVSSAACAYATSRAS